MSLESTGCTFICMCLFTSSSDYASTICIINSLTFIGITSQKVTELECNSSKDTAVFPAWQTDIYSPIMVFTSHFCHPHHPFFSYSLTWSLAFSSHTAMLCLSPLWLFLWLKSSSFPLSCPFLDFPLPHFPHLLFMFARMSDRCLFQTPSCMGAVVMAEWQASCVCA